MPLVEQDKVRIRAHLGFLGVQESATFVLGVPAGVQTEFLIELAMNKVLESSIPKVQQYLNILDTIEGQMVEDMELLAIDAIGDITVRKDEQEALVKRYDYWVANLANILGCYRNPFDKRLATGSSIGNVRVG
jgi:hypothetical protein